MCGISGKIYFDKRKIDKQEISAMASSISSRGPDDTGFYISPDQRLAFAHNRLSIIDLSSFANQPMVYMDRYVITFNGEIYNYQEQRDMLEKEGYFFQNKSDTEVILALYAKYKEKCLKHLRGMFAFAIYDKKLETVFLARDRVGKKPLKYFLDNSCFIFASELKAIITQKEVKKEVDQLAIQKYLLYGYIPAPLTGFKNIKKLSPGHFAMIDLKRNTFIIKKYWQISFAEKLQLSEDEWSNRILSTLEESTRLRMISDVPIGAFLSGGVDSSAVVAMMSRLSSKPVKTFTIRHTQRRWDEGKFARIIAKKYKTDHHEFFVKPKNAEILPEIASSYEEPFADNSSILTFLISKEARKKVKVVLNGDGSDELFAGYPNRYFRLERDVNFDFWIKNTRPMALKTIKALIYLRQNNNMLNKLNNFLIKSELPLYERFVSYNNIFNLNQILEMTKGELSDTMTYNNLYKYTRHVFNNFDGPDLKDAGLLFDLKYFLPDQLLTKMDIATMHYGLEARSPLLDQNMVELATKIPFSLKVKNGQTKYIFKKALEKIVPKENLYRPKMGFTVPLEEWFKDNLEDFYNSKINKRSHINQMLNLKNMDGWDNHQRWSILMLELWLRNYFPNQ